MRFGGFSAAIIALPKTGEKHLFLFGNARKKRKRKTGANCSGILRSRRYTCRFDHRHLQSGHLRCFTRANRLNHTHFPGFLQNSFRALFADIFVLHNDSSGKVIADRIIGMQFFPGICDQLLVRLFFSLLPRFFFLPLAAFFFRKGFSSATECTHSAWGLIAQLFPIDLQG